MFPDRKTCAKKNKLKKETRKRGRKNISFRANCKFWAKESTISEPKSLRPFPFLCIFFEHVEASTSPKLDFVLCLYHDKLSLRRATPRRIWLSKTDLKTAVLPGPLPDGRRSGGDEGLGSRLGSLSRYQNFLRTETTNFRFTENCTLPK